MKDRPAVPDLNDTFSNNATRPNTNHDENKLDPAGPSVIGGFALILAFAFLWRCKKNKEKVAQEKESRTGFAEKQEKRLPSIAEGRYGEEEAAFLSVTVTSSTSSSPASASFSLPPSASVSSATGDKLIESTILR